MDIGKALEDAWRLFVKDIGALILGVLVAVVLSIVSIGILAGPLLGGVFKMVSRRVREGRPAEIGDVFAGFDRFWTLFAAFWVLGIIVAIGYLFLIIPGLLLSAIWLYVFLFIVDRDMSLGEAMSASRELVMRTGLWLHVAVVLLIGIVSAIVGHITGIGFLLTYPLSVTFVAALYFRGQREDALVDAATASGGYTSPQYAPPAPPVQYPSPSQPTPYAQPSATAGAPATSGASAPPVGTGSPAEATLADGATPPASAPAGPEPDSGQPVQERPLPPASPA